MILPEEILTLPQLVRENSEEIGRLEQAVADLVELHNRTEKKTEELVETQRRGYEEFLAYRQATDTAFRELAETVRRNHDELRADVAELRAGQEELRRGQADMQKAISNLCSDMGGFANMLGATIEEEAQSQVPAFLRDKGYTLVGNVYALHVDGVAESDVVQRVVTPEGISATVLAEAKARLSRRAVTDWANRMRSEDLRKRLQEQGIDGPYLVYSYGIVVYRDAIEAAEEMGIGIMNPRKEVVAPAGLLE